MSFHRIYSTIRHMDWESDENIRMENSMDFYTARINYHQEGSRYVFLLSIPSVYVLRFARVTNMLASKLERLESVEIGHKGRRRHEKGLKKNRDVEERKRERDELC